MTQAQKIAGLFDGSDQTQAAETQEQFSPERGLAFTSLGRAAPSQIRQQRAKENKSQESNIKVL